MKLFSITILAAVCAAGCSKAPPPAPAPLAASQVQPVLKQTLAKASAEARDQANKYTTDVQNRNWGAALDDIHDLMHRNDLTPEQRLVLGRVMRTTVTQMQNAAESGDQQAADILQEARRSK